LPDTGQSGSLTLCPSDVIATAGEDIVLQAAGEPGTSLRWYKKQWHPGSSEVNVVIYTGEKMDYRPVIGIQLKLLHQ